MKRIIAAAGAALLTVGVVAGAGPAAAAASPAATVNGYSVIAYASGAGGLWTMKPDGTAQHEIDTTPYVASLSFSPNGKQIAFTSLGEIWIVPTAGGTAHQLTHSGGTIEDVAWSPNGQWLALARNLASGGGDIYEMKPSGGAMTRVSFGAKYDCYTYQPAWSPNSASLVYIREAGSSMCLGDGLVVQEIGHPGVTVVSGDGLETPAFTPTDNLVYLGQCPDLQEGCGDPEVGWESATDGSDAHVIDIEGGCQAGDLCLDAIVGAPNASRGWMTLSQYHMDGDPISDAESCYQGGYQKAGVVTGTAPQFCLSGVLASSIAVH